MQGTHNPLTVGSNPTGPTIFMNTTQQPDDILTHALKWSGTAFTLLGAVLTSAALDPYNVWCLNVGSTWFLWWAIRIRDPAMITVNGGLLLIYLSGTLRTILT
jgi:hypothetical protein